MYDVIIIGKGPAGISTSLYTQRSNLKTLVIGKDKGALEKADKIENYYGFPNAISGRELLENGVIGAKKIGVEILTDEVLSVSYEDANNYKVITKEGEYNSKTLVFATGTTRKSSKVENVDKFEGKGVSYCAVCDGFFYRGKDVAVLGAGDYAIHEATELVPLVNSISLLTNGAKKLELRSDKIKVYDNSVKRLKGEDTLEAVELDDNTIIPISGIFIAEGTASSTDFAKKLGIQIENNYIAVDAKRMTNIPGVFAVGDCTKGLKQISRAVADGAIAGISVKEYLRSVK